MANVYPNGVGGSTGDDWVTTAPLLMSGAVWYVNSTTGTDAASPAGRNREKPLATLAQAHTNASDGDIIVFLSTHAQTLTSGQTISKKVVLVGEGSTAGVPTVRFTCNFVGSIFSITTGNVELRNLYIPTSALANNTTRITCNQTDLIVDGCYFECGANDTAAALTLAAGGDRAWIADSTFISTATLTSAQPESALKASAALSDLMITGTVFDAGTVGFSNYFALDASAGAITRIRGLDISLLRGADVKLHASTTGRFNVSTFTGSSRVEW